MRKRPCWLRFWCRFRKRDLFRIVSCKEELRDAKTNHACHPEGDGELYRLPAGAGARDTSVSALARPYAEGPRALEIPPFSGERTRVGKAVPSDSRASKAFWFGMSCFMWLGPKAAFFKKLGKPPMQTRQVIVKYVQHTAPSRPFSGAGGGNGSFSPGALG